MDNIKRDYLTDTSIPFEGAVIMMVVCIPIILLFIMIPLEIPLFFKIGNYFLSMGIMALLGQIYAYIMLEWVSNYD